MIYFEFAICRDTQVRDADYDSTTAEFMFDSDNPGECTRRAAVLLKARGWRAMSVKKALEAFRVEDFGEEPRITALYRRAESGGVGYWVNTAELAELAPEELV